MLHALQPDTVVRWHRAGFRHYWRWKSRRRRVGRPPVDREIRNLIHGMQSANTGWSAPRIHGELRKLGIEVSQATVSKYMEPHRKPPSQTWRTFLDNHVADLASMDFFTVPPASPHRSPIGRLRSFGAQFFVPTVRCRRWVAQIVAAEGVYGVRCGVKQGFSRLIRDL